MIYVVDDDRIMARCVQKACRGNETKIFGNAIEVMDAISGGEIPDLMFLDVLLIGPDGFALLNEMVSYADTAQIPVVLITSLEIENQDLASYGVVGVLKKETMRPEDVRGYVEKYV